MPTNSILNTQRYYRLVGLMNKNKYYQSDMFDFVITKEISRFARNTLDSIQFTRELLKNGVGVFFQNDDIYPH